MPSETPDAVRPSATGVVSGPLIDTTNSRVVATDFVRGEITVGGDVLALEARSEARFTRGLRLRDFVIRADGDITPFMMRGAIQEGEDKTLRTTLKARG